MVDRLIQADGCVIEQRNLWHQRNVTLKRSWVPVPREISFPIALQSKLKYTTAYKIHLPTVHTPYSR